ncbi:hydroxyacylglutathione hydrolase [candidate division FCPU426 bacterium]|nr:hydroxyacylglutathione hydrolase [candidate division FCPU426 bacterium]
MPIHILPLAEDNYCYVLQDGQEACVIDPGFSEPVARFLDDQKLQLQLILNTHHHSDHCGGNQNLKEMTGCRIYPLAAGTASAGTVVFGSAQLQVMATPGHSRDSVCFYLPGQPGLLFTGDTLFIGGCGRIFGGTAEQLFASLQRLAALPEDTLLYCGHEYTLHNLAFALSIHPENAALQAFYREMQQRRLAQLPTVPSTIGREKQINAFLQAADARSFARLRRQKDVF